MQELNTQQGAGTNSQQGAGTKTRIKVQELTHNKVHGTKLTTRCRN
ncbi:hypothetical protein HYE00_03815 [Mycoplasmopsis bovis]|nr:hypothetical protein [Mycoplasmopsis bovis]QQH28804.1 hypothetical protein HYE00_03815 [Mycoplasmopsis bovis]